jgi:predicted phosphodiesterase
MAIRFLHAADLHWGLRITRYPKDVSERLAEARFQAIQNLRDVALAQRVQFIILAGDIFDDISIDRHWAGRVFGLLSGTKTQCPIFAIPGNHDPLIPGGLWDRDPWNRTDTKHWRILRKRQRLVLEDFPVDLFPCPLNERRSLEDPTAWIAGEATCTPGRFRIGIAHGSLNVLPDLPLDDHLIRPDAAEHYGLDYLALGHWHSRFDHKDSHGVIRSHYPGTHEPMTFHEQSAADTIGWLPASGAEHRFRGNRAGAVSVVTIDHPGAPPIIEPQPVQHLQWESRSVECTDDTVGTTIRTISEYPSPMTTLLQLKITGVLQPERYARICAELRDGLMKRFHPGSSYDDTQLHIEPTADQLEQLVGTGLLRQVLDELKTEVQSTDPQLVQRAQDARRLLFQFAMGNVS